MNDAIKPFTSLIYISPLKLGNDVVKLHTNCFRQKKNLDSEIYVGRFDEVMAETVQKKMCKFGCHCASEISFNSHSMNFKTCIGFQNKLFYNVLMCCKKKHAQWDAHVAHDSVYAVHGNLVY